ncbi:hypothetical protein PR048_022535 [Dryococelus australis]|uniref:Uncharacterized protein n=1 Tax=Dryococelus australis TaxID=614101 RepID=A0ABQ9H194_9NEOP|nr:hypothetical protein PR048_022535 [Dryococelus australis]
MQAGRRETRKRARVTGEQYVTKHGKIVAERKSTALGVCRMKCQEIIPDEQRVKILKEYWNIGTSAGRVAYSGSLMEIQNPAKHRQIHRYHFRKEKIFMQGNKAHMFLITSYPRKDWINQKLICCYCQRMKVITPEKIPRKMIYFHIIRCQVFMRSTKKKKRIPMTTFPENFMKVYFMNLNDLSKLIVRIGVQPVINTNHFNRRETKKTEHEVERYHITAYKAKKMIEKNPKMIQNAKLLLLICSNGFKHNTFTVRWPFTSSIFECTILPRTIVILGKDICQNNNAHVAAMCMVALQNTRHFNTIDHKSLVPGHTRMECDADHSLIENKKKYNIPIHHPHDWMQLVGSTGKKNLLLVKEMKREYFFSYSELLKGPLLNRKRYDDGSNAN